MRKPNLKSDKNPLCTICKDFFSIFLFFKNDNLSELVMFARPYQATRLFYCSFFLYNHISFNQESPLFEK